MWSPSLARSVMFIDDLGMRDREKGCLPISCIAQERTAKIKKENGE